MNVNKKNAPDKVKKAESLAEAQTKALASVLDKVEDNVKIKDKVEDKVEDIETKTLIAATTEETTLADGFLILSEKYAAVSSALAVSNSELTAITKKKELADAQVSSANSECSLLTKAAAHACEIYAMQIGAKTKDYGAMSPSALTKQFVGLRSEFLEKFPSDQTSINPGANTNEPDSFNLGNHHQISTVKSRNNL